MTTSTSFPTLPMLLAATPSGTAAAMSIALDFNTAMAAGAGTITVTDGALQTVIDRITGLPTTRVVGGTDTHILSAADLVIDGNHVTLAVGGLLAGHTYSVLMGADALVSSDELAFGGMRSTSQLQFTTPPAPTDASPLPIGIHAVPGAGAYSVGATIEIDVTFGAAVTLTDTDNLALRLNNGSTATFSHLSDDGARIVFSYQVGVGDGETAHLELADAGADLAGHVANAAGNVMGAVDLSGYHLGTNGAGIAIDVHADTPATPMLAAASDSGVQGDGITDVTAPVIRGSGAEAGAHIHVIVGGDDILATDADAAGDWTWSGLHDLEPGNEYSVNAYQVDLAGNVSLVSEALALTIAAAPAGPPAPPAPLLSPASDSCTSHQDNITNDTTPTLTGAGAMPGNEVALYDGDTLLGHTRANAQGAWSYTVAGGPVLADGVHAITVRQIDDHDHLGDASAALMLTIDTTAPTLITAQPFVSGSKNWFSLEFSEKIVLPANGGIDVDGDSHGGQSQHAGNVHTNWDISNNAAGVASVLELNLGTLYGLVHLSLEGSGIQDVAGNVAIIGNASYTIPGL